MRHGAGLSKNMLRTCLNAELIKTSRANVKVELNFSDLVFVPELETVPRQLEAKWDATRFALPRSARRLPA